MDGRGARNAARRLVLELMVLVLLVGLPVDFPTSGRAWDFLLRHPTFALHAVVGTVVLVEAVVLVVRSVRSGRISLLIAGAGLAAVLVAFCAGTAYVGGGQQGSSLMLMTLGWVGALATYVVGWVVGHRTVASSRGAAAQRSG